MTIIAHSAPRSVRTTAQAAVRRVLHKAKHIPSLRRAPQIAIPLPVYRITAKNLSAANPLAHARKIGWRCPIVGGDVAGLMLLLDRRDGTRYGGITEGHLAEGLLKAALFAEKRLRASPIEFEARLLDIPSLQLQALWLRAARGVNRFVCFHEHGSAQEMKLDESVAKLIDRVATKSDRPRAARKRRPSRKPSGDTDFP